MAENAKTGALLVLSETAFDDDVETDASPCRCSSLSCVDQQFLHKYLTQSTGRASPLATGVRQLHLNRVRCSPIGYSTSGDKAVDQDPGTWLLEAAETAGSGLGDCRRCLTIDGSQSVSRQSEAVSFRAASSKRIQQLSKRRRQLVHDSIISPLGRTLHGYLTRSAMGDAATQAAMVVRATRPT